MAKPNKEQRELLKEPVQHDMRWMTRYIMASDAYKNGTMPELEPGDELDFDIGWDLDTGWFEK